MNRIMKKQERQTNFEVLRILSMILVVMSHCDEFFGLSGMYNSTLGINKIITDFLHMGGQVGVGCFILISGYFMIDKSITGKKLLCLAGEVWFYTIGIWFVWSVYNVFQHDFSVQECLHEARFAFFPILTGYYWFVTSYVVLMLLSPFLNKLIFAMNQREYRFFLFTIVTIFVILKGGIPTVFPGMVEGRFYPVLIMYFIAGYIRRFRSEKKGNGRKHLLIAVISYAFLFSVTYLLTAIGILMDSSTIMSYRYFYRALNSPFVVVVCTELFIGFMEMNLAYRSWVNNLARCMFGVYLIHANKLMSNFWEKCFPIYKEGNSFCIFIYSIASVIIIFVVCCAIDYVRTITFGKWWNKLMDKVCLCGQGVLEKRVQNLTKKCNSCLRLLYDDTKK